MVLKPFIYILFICDRFTYVCPLSFQTYADKAFVAMCLPHTVSLLSRLELELLFVIQTDSLSLHCCLNDVFKLLLLHPATNNCFLLIPQYNLLCRITVYTPDSDRLCTQQNVFTAQKQLSFNLVAVNLILL